MLLFVEIKEILSWTIFGQILEELAENITGNSSDNFRKIIKNYNENYRKF